MPAPTPKLASRYESDTARSASSVVLIISGSTIIANVAAPASIEYPHFKYVTKNNIPNKPYTIDGIPESDGAAAFFSQEDTVTGKLQTQIYKLYDIMKAHEEQELALKNQLSGLVADLVHQMNTPLTNIRMYCDFLQMPDLSAENKNHFLSNISRQAEKLGWFGEGFEKATRLETDIITLTPVEQELLPIILEAANQASQTITPDSIRMAATMIATIPIIMVYPFIQKYFVKGIMLGSVKS